MLGKSIHIMAELVELLEEMAQTERYSERNRRQCDRLLVQLNNAAQVIFELSRIVIFEVFF